MPLDIRARLRAAIDTKTNSSAIIEKPQSRKVGNIWGLKPVEDSAELQRVLAIPCRPYKELVTQDEVKRLSDELRRPGGAMELRPIQAAALKEAQSLPPFESPFLMMGVGSGKTLVSLLQPTVLKVKVTVLFVPAALRDKLFKVEYPFLSAQWRLPNLDGSKFHYADTDSMLYVLSYEELSHKKGISLLEDLKPDLIIADEAHKLARDSTRTKRFRRYMKAHPHTRFVPLSGSMTRDSIKDFSTLLRFALKEHAPIPSHPLELEAWACVLDVSPIQAEPGALEQMMKMFGKTDPREAFAERLLQTPGVVSTGSSRIDVSLNIYERPLAIPRPAADALKLLRDEWCTPGGEYFSGALDFYRHARTLACGLYNKWTWPRKEPIEVRREWIEARAEWHKEVRKKLKGDARPGLDSPDQLFQAAQRYYAGLESGTSKTHLKLMAASTGEPVWPSTTWKRWQGVMDSAEPATVPVWVDDFMAQDAVAWGKEHIGIIFVESPELGRKIAELGGFPYYGESSEVEQVLLPNGETGPAILAERGDRTIVASIGTWGEGHNLQMFNEMLITCPPSNNNDWEQAMGRCHRQGQMAHEVNVYVYLHTPEFRKAVEDSLEDARYHQSITQNEQKLNYCTFNSTLVQKRPSVPPTGVANDAIACSRN
jgi:hypothetical protein